MSDVSVSAVSSPAASPGPASMSIGPTTGDSSPTASPNVSPIATAVPSGPTTTVWVSTTTNIVTTGAATTNAATTGTATVTVPAPKPTVKSSSATSLQKKLSVMCVVMIILPAVMNAL